MIACPTCGGRTEVTETRHTRSGVRRRRQCLKIGSCFGRVTTIEIAVPDRQAADFADLVIGASVIVTRSQLKRLRKIVAEICGGPQ